VITLIEELKTFIAVVDKKSFTKAAASIHISQPSVSLHIVILEKYFNTRLIERSNKQRSILITQTGEMLYKKAKQIISILAETKDELNSYHNATSGTLKIGASMTIGEFLLPEILGEFMKEFPNITPEVTIQNTHDIYEEFKNYNIDIALIEGTVPRHDYTSKKFYKDTMVLVTPNSFTYNKNTVFTTCLSNQTWIHREEGCGNGENLKIFLDSEGISPKNFIVFGSNYAIKEAVKNNLGLSFISSLIVANAAKNKELKILPTKIKYNRYFSYLIHEKNLPRIATFFVEKLDKFSKLSK
jgi:LysR family transcriptional regulator, transcriptional activator of the cysJI operon